MEELVKKLTQLIELSKALKDGPKMPTIPGIKPISPPSISPSTSKQAKIPGMNPDSKKDPKKIAQQIKDGSMSTKTQKVMLKFDENGQWQLEDIDKAEKKIHPKDPALNPDKFPQKGFTPEKLKELSQKLENFKNKALKKEEVQSSSEEK